MSRYAFELNQVVVATRELKTQGGTAFAIGDRFVVLRRLDGYRLRHLATGLVVHKVREAQLRALTGDEAEEPRT